MAGRAKERPARFLVAVEVEPAEDVAGAKGERLSREGGDHLAGEVRTPVPGDRRVAGGVVRGAPWRGRGTTARAFRGEAREGPLAAGGEHKSAGALRVSLADKLHNARAIRRDLDAHGAELWERFTASGPETAGYYVELAAAFEACLPKLGPRTGQAVAELRDLAEDLGRSVA